MSESDQDRVVGAAHRRLVEIRKHEACLQSKVASMARELKAAASRFDNRTCLPVKDGFAVPEFPGHDTITDAVRQLGEATQSRQAAEEEWERLSR